MPTVADVLSDHPSKDTFDLHELSRCIQALLECSAACTVCADACLAEDDVTSQLHCIRTDLDCADICSATARVLSRAAPSGDMWRHLLEACAKACAECAAECERHTGHKHCQLCGQMCREAEKACQQLLVASAD